MSSAERDRDPWLTLLFVLLVLSGLAVLALGVWLAWTQEEYVLLGLGVLAVVVPASAYALAGRDGRERSMEALLQEQKGLLESINERLLISDQAKRIAFRQKDREALRQAIVEDVRREDYDAAAALIEELAQTYGSTEEAEEFRQQLIEKQAHQREVMVERAVSRIDALCDRYEWNTALQEAARLRRMYPEHPTVEELPKRIAQAREKHKYDLESAFLKAAQRDDIERAMELLKELDRYLTPEEAAPYIETARGVVGKKRQNLGVQFKMAVQERDWVKALQTGEQITREFPNSTFSREVRGMLDLLRARATAQRAADAHRHQSV